MYTHYNHFVALERIADMQRAAERSRRLAEARTNPERPSGRRQVQLSRGWLGLRRRLKLA